MIGWKISSRMEFSSHGCTTVQRNESKCPGLFKKYISKIIYFFIFSLSHHVYEIDGVKFAKFSKINISFASDQFHGK